MQHHPFPDPQDAPHVPTGDASPGPDRSATPARSRSRTRTWGAALGLLAAGAVGGAALAGTLDASAATPSPTSSTASVEGGRSTGTFPAHGSAAHEGAEKAVTGSDATKAQAAAVKAAGGGTAGAVTTDMTGSGFEVTVTKSDGTTTEIHLDSSFAVMSPGAGHGGPDGAADNGVQPAG